jgi:hypothetical protein
MTWKGYLARKALIRLEAWHRGTVLKKVCAAVQLHEPEQVVLQHSLVAFTVYCDVYWKKVEATMPQSARKTPPNHNTVRVFHSFDGVVAVKPDAVLWPPHFDPGRPRALKRGLIGVHYLEITLYQSSEVQCL